MNTTHRTLISAALVAGSALALAPAANAGPVMDIAAAVGSSCNSSDTLASSNTGSVVWNAALSFGTFSVSADGVPVSGPPDLLDSQTIDATSSSKFGQFSICVTQTGVSATVTGPVLSSLTTNRLPKGWILTESTYADGGDGAYGLTDLLYTHTFNGPLVNDTSAWVSPLSFGAPYSLTEVYTITPGNLGTTNDTIDIAQVPEPATLAIFAGGLLAGGLALRRRRRA